MQADALLDGLILAVGVCTLEVQADEGRAVHSLDALCHVGHGLAAGIEFLKALLRIGSQTSVGQLYADLRCVRNGRVEGVEGQDVISAELDSLVASADGDGADRGIERLLFCFKSHFLCSS